MSPRSCRVSPFSTRACPLLAGLAAASLLLAGSGCGRDPAAPRATPAPAVATIPSEPAPGPVARRGLWVLCEGSQRVLEHPERLDTLLADARALGVSDLFVQVYRGGRAWFPSTHADAGPYQSVWRTEEGDALTVLLARAHADGLRVHAWVNVLSLAGYRDAPLLDRLGRAAVQMDQFGRSVLDYPELEVPPPQAGFYRMGTPAVWLDPAAPGVAEHLAATFSELVQLYPALDGLHLDYARYPDVLPFSPGTRFGVGLSFGHGEATRARFRRETGLEAPFQGSLRNGNRFDDWRRDELTALVGTIRAQARRARPGLTLSAAVWAWPDRAYLSVFQDWRRWLEDGLLEFAVPMLYTLDERLLRYGVSSFAGSPEAPRIWVGLGSWLFAGTPERAAAQLAQVERHPGLGSALFSWDSIADAPPLRAALAGRARSADAALPTAPAP